MKKVLFINIISGIIIFSGCEESKIEKPTYDRTELLNNISSNIIIPGYKDLVQKADSLTFFINTFADSPTETNLIQAQNQWKTTLWAYNRVEMFKFGPANVETVLENDIYTWPVNSTLIEREITATGINIIDAAYIQSSGTSRKGLAAIEYLIFSKDSGNQVVIAQFTTKSNASRASLYLKALAQDIKNQTLKVYDKWNNSYKSTFIAAKGTDIGSSTGLLVNQLAFEIEVIIKRKIGNPLGKKTSRDTTINILPKQVEAYESSVSVESMKQNVITLERVFTGDSGAGFDDYLSKIELKNADGKPLSDAIILQISNLKTAINKIPSPMSESIQVDTKPAIDAWLDARRLLVLVKTDMMSGMGIQPSFSDSDGD
jgi:hypothetical protein